MLQMEQQIDAIFREMIKDVLDSANVSDAISITINHNSFTEPMFIYWFKDNFDVKRIQTALFKLSQSNSRWVEIDSS